jgi:hypothetical protein
MIPFWVIVKGAPAILRLFAELQDRLWLAPRGSRRAKTVLMRAKKV